MRQETTMPRRSLRRRDDKSPLVYNHKRKRVSRKHALAGSATTPGKQKQLHHLSQTTIKKTRSNSIISEATIKINGKYQVPLLTPPPKKTINPDRRSSAATTSLDSGSTSTTATMQPGKPSSTFNFFPDSKIAYIELPPPSIPLNRGPLSIIIDSSKCINCFITLEFLHHPYGRDVVNPATDKPYTPTRMVVLEQTKVEDPITEFHDISLSTDLGGQCGAFSMNVYISRIKSRWEFGFEDEYKFEVMPAQFTSFPSYVLHVTGPQNAFGQEIGREVDGVHCGGPETLRQSVAAAASPESGAGSRQGSTGSSSPGSVGSPSPVVVGGVRPRRSGLPPIGLFHPPFSHVGARDQTQQTAGQQDIEMQGSAVREHSPGAYSDVSSVSTLTQFTEVFGVDDEAERVGDCIVLRY